MASQLAGRPSQVAGAGAAEAVFVLGACVACGLLKGSQAQSPLQTKATSPTMRIFMDAPVASHEVCAARSLSAPRPKGSVGRGGHEEPLFRVIICAGDSTEPADGDAGRRHSR